MLADYDVSTVVIGWQQQPDLARALTTEGTWQPAYCDAQGGVFVRRDQAAGAPAPCPLP